MKQLIFLISTALLIATCSPVKAETVGHDLTLRAYTDCLLLKDTVLQLTDELRAGKLTMDEYYESVEKYSETLSEATYKYFINKGYSRNMAEQMTIWNLNILRNIAKKDNGNCEIIRNLQL